MDVTSTTPATSTATTDPSLKQLSGNFSTFLTLLTTQLKNQDPTSPMDSNQFTQQLVMYSQVEQQIGTNDNLKTLIATSQVTNRDRLGLRDLESTAKVYHTLYDNFLQAQILSQEAVTSAHHMEAYEDLMVGLETREVLDRELEALPNAEEMAERRRTTRGDQVRGPVPPPPVRPAATARSAARGAW